VGKEIRPVDRTPLVSLLSEPLSETSGIPLTGLISFPSLNSPQPTPL